MATLGRSSAVGSVGYAACALEIQAQSNNLDIDFAAVLVPNGSSGTQAGLVAGYRALGLDTTRVRSHTVLAPAAAAIAATVEKANAVLTLLGFGRLRARMTSRSREGSWAPAMAFRRRR